MGYAATVSRTASFALENRRVGRAGAVLIPRDRTHFSKLQTGYPLAEEFLDYPGSEGVGAVAIDDGDRIHAFDLSQYRTGDQVGHAPYPMKRVADLDDATRSPDGDGREAERRAAEWEWLTGDDLRPARERADRTDGTASSSPRETRDESITGD